MIEAKLKRLEKRLYETFASPANKSPSETPAILAAAPPVAAVQLQTRIYCDTGPILERELAARAGLGWIGKHTLLLHPRHGSWFLLGELVTSLDLEPDSPLADHCGTCRRCIEACPTAAITPYHVDATRCISYQTRENRAPTIPPNSMPPCRRPIFCSAATSARKSAPSTAAPWKPANPTSPPASPAPAISLQTVLEMQEAQWDQLTRGSATRRAKLPMWQRNAKALLKP